MQIENKYLIMGGIILLALFLFGSGKTSFFETVYTSGTGWNINRFYFTKSILLQPEPLKGVFTIKYQTWYSRDYPGIPSIWTVTCIDGQCTERQVSGWISTTTFSAGTRQRSFTFSIPTQSLTKGFHTVEVYVLGLGEGYYLNREACHTSFRIWDAPLFNSKWKPYLKEPIKRCELINNAMKKIDWIKLAKDAEAHKLPTGLYLTIWYSKPYKFLVCQGDISSNGCGIQVTKYITQTKYITKYIDCRTTGCPSGYECSIINNDYVCKQKQTMFKPLLVGIAVGALIAVYEVVRKRR